MNYGPYTGVCPVCGKWFLTMWQEHWIHRRGDTFYCCEDCYLIDLKRDLKAMQEARQRRKDEKKVGARKITLEMKKKAVEIAISGGNPLDYLKSVGCKKPDGYWYTIKADLKKTDPETYAKIPDYRGKTRKPAEKPATVKVDGALRIETPEPEKVKVETPESAEPKPLLPATYDGMVIREVEGLFGRYRYTDIGSAEYIDYENSEGLDTLSMTVDQWKRFREEQAKAARILGVEL